jgi:hypothetical protein
VARAVAGAGGWKITRQIENAQARAWPNAGDFLKTPLKFLIRQPARRVAACVMDNAPFPARPGARRALPAAIFFR